MSSIGKLTIVIVVEAVSVSTVRVAVIVAVKTVTVSVATVLVTVFVATVAIVVMCPRGKLDVQKAWAAGKGATRVATVPITPLHVAAETTIDAMCMK